MAGLNDRWLGWVWVVVLDAGGAGEEAADGDGVGGVVGAPWSMTLRTSLGPRMLAVTWMPPVPQP